MGGAGCISAERDVELGEREVEEQVDGAAEGVGRSYGASSATVMGP